MSGDETVNNYVGEAEDTRERIAATIDELQDRLNPRRIVGDAAASVQAGGVDLLNEAVRLVRAHPVIVAGAGLAVGLALVGGNRLSKATVDLGDGYEAYSDYDDDYSANSSGNTGQRFALTRDGASAAIGRNPLIAIFVGLVAGAALGALFPETEGERRLLAGLGDRLSDAERTACAKVNDAAHDASAAMHSTVDGVTAELHDSLPG